MSDLGPEEAFPDPAPLLKKARRIYDAALMGKARVFCALSLLLAAAWALSVNWPQIGVALAMGRGRAASYDPSVLAEAKSLGLDYDDVLANPAAHAGKPVLWCLVKQMGSDKPFVNGNMAWIVDMPGGDIEPVATGRMGVCKPTLARVSPSAGPGVHLTFLAHP